jgi:(1->4)-alpha-D-glucan 1-alpha-D-glucosylmutase
VAYSRAGQAVTVATRLPAGLRRAGGWQETVLPVAAGRWLDVLTGARYDGGQVRLAELTAALPVALLVRT